MKVYLGLLGNLEETLRKYEAQDSKDDPRICLTDEEFYILLDQCVEEGKFLVIPSSRWVN